MLEALELIGFKSFADKTRFEFPAGITVIVGPNGSGKSNIVDAIKWVLGEQSAKNLRGKDMADVIFKGAGGAGRRVANTAEATLIINNSDRRLSIDAPEVHVTRRVYRSGEGEYLINRQPCRLKDVRDLFRGTGVGPDAYSLIEQGKVDSLLQASARDRRAMFEEAAGISRFKAKKIEAQRRLERVEQNLLRLSDIVQEVESRLRRVRSQAVKARRYRQHSERLQELRIQVGLSDWRRLTEKLAAREADIEGIRSQAEDASTRADAMEARSLQLETEIGAGGDRIRDCERQLARIREEIATRQSTIEHERARCLDLEQEAEHPRRRLLAMTSREGDLLERWRRTAASVEQAEADREETCSRLQQLEYELDELTGRLARLRSENDGRRNRYVERMRELGTLGNQVSRLETERAALDAAVRQGRRRLEEIEQVHATHCRELERLGVVEARLAEEVERRTCQLEEARLELAESRRLLIRRQEDLAERQGRLSGVQQRAAVLEELEKNLEGVGAGAREVMDRAARETSGPFAEVRGLVADLLEAPVELAPLVDMALGPAAQYVVVAGDSLVRRIQSQAYRPSARVGLLRLDGRRPHREPPGAELEGKPGVIGRADRVVDTADEFAPGIRSLLARTWLVETLADALALRETAAGQLRFVTRRGELLESNGVVVAGPQRVAAGLVSRRSQLRALEQQIAGIREQIGVAEEEIQRLRQNLEQQELAVRRAMDQRDRLGAELAEHRLQVRTLQARREQLEQERRTTESQLQEAAARSETTTRQCEEARERLASQEASVAEMEAAIRSDDDGVRQLEAAGARLSRQATAAKVEAAKSEQRLESLRVRLAELVERKGERTRTIAEAHNQLAQIAHRLRQAERAILHASSSSSELHLRKEALERETARQADRRGCCTKERTEVVGQLQALRRQFREIQEELHGRELGAGEIRHQRTALVERLREDYGVDLETYEIEASQEAREQRQAIDEEIAALRRKISNIGPVNMDALDELDALEARFDSLSGQHRDLAEAKQSLERIIQKINVDSRRLFVETLDAIRTNFQTLYRRSFGGGKADIVLEEGVDVLEAGIEIIATPPGKPSFNNSLLSGGEKALTAVALLLAVFQYRPSPFCVLDEVDAPFDEANIGRFIEVLKSFLGWTKFVIVTHSKKTMTAATTLYGVTMQESGVSKQVSVRFEDVSEDGHIRREAVDRQLAREAEDDERGAA